MASKQSRVVIDATAPAWAQHMTADVNSIIGQLGAQVSMMQETIASLNTDVADLKARVTVLEGS